MGTFKDLLAWQKSLTLAKKVYQVTGNFPTEERFGLVNQMRRCAVSIPSNIAEGYGRGSDKELLRFLYVALGSSNELETQLILSLELSFMKEEDSRMLQGLNTEVNKMILSLIYRRKNGLDKNSRTWELETKNLKNKKLKN